MRRWAGLLLAVATLVVAAPAQACACGGVVDQPGGDTSVSAETAVVVWDGAQETILLRLSTRSEAVTAGLLVPTPTPATVDLGDEQVFTDLADVIAPRTEERRHLFGPPLFFGAAAVVTARRPADPGAASRSSTRSTSARCARPRSRRPTPARSTAGSSSTATRPRPPSRPPSSRTSTRGGASSPSSSTRSARASRATCRRSP